ncbi:unnamed protein product, partial [Effrenium voratum]
CFFAPGASRAILQCFSCSCPSKPAVDPQPGLRDAAALGRRRSGCRRRKGSAARHLQPQPLRDRALREASDCQQLQIATAAACKARLQSEAGNYKQARLASNGPAAEPTDMARKLTEAALWILCYSPETLLLRHGVY